MVELKFVAQVYNGCISLVIDRVSGISLYQGEVNLAPFIGKIESDLSTLQGIYSSCFQDSLPMKYMTTGIEEVGAGRVGGFAAVMQTTIVSLLGMSWLTQEQIKDSCIVFLLAAEAYFEFLQDKQSHGVQRGLNQIMRVGHCCPSDRRSLVPIISECASVLCGIAKPTHLYSHQIAGAFTAACTALELNILNSTLPLGAEVWTRGVTLASF